MSNKSNFDLKKELEFILFRKAVEKEHCTIYSSHEVIEHGKQLLINDMNLTTIGK